MSMTVMIIIIMLVEVIMMMISIKMMIIKLCHDAILHNLMPDAAQSIIRGSV